MLSSAVEAFLSLALTSFFPFPLPALLLLALLLSLALLADPLEDELERDLDRERDEDFEREPDLADLELLEPAEELRDLDLEELLEFDLDLSESEPELLDNLERRLSAAPAAMVVCGSWM